MREAPPGPAPLLPALAWLARLPLLGDRELGQLLGVGEREAARRRRELERRGWVEWVLPDSRQVQPRRRSLLRPGALPALAELLGRPPEEIARLVAARPREALIAIAATEAAVGVNALLAGLAREPGEPDVALADARRLPQDRREPHWSGAAAPGPSRARPGPAEPWYPRGALAYGCLRARGFVAPFFVAWDRAGAPPAHRRDLLRSWEAFLRSESPWGPGGLPPVVVAAAGEEELAQWRDAARSHGPLLGRPLPLALATVAELASAGPGGALWRAPDAPGRAPLSRRLDWSLPEELPEQAAPLAWAELRTGVPRREAAPPPLRRRARELRLPRRGARARRLRLALLTLATDAEEKRLVEYVGRNPLLDGKQLAALLDLPPLPAGRRLARLLRLGLIAPVFRRAKDDSRPTPRFLLSQAGLRWLAARDGVPYTRYARSAAALGLADAGGTRLSRPSRAYRDFEHTLGVNRVLVRLDLDARAAGARLARWHPDAAAERRFPLPDGRWARIAPDGAGVLARGAEVVPFLLEYERGTRAIGRYREKLAGYRAYFALGRWRADFPEKPLLLFACVDYGARAIALRAAARWSPRQDLLLAIEENYKAGTGGGILGPVWCSRAAPALLDTLFGWQRSAARGGTGRPAGAPGGPGATGTVEPAGG